jgi:hypothetical protein
METQDQENSVESVTMSDILQLSTSWDQEEQPSWNRERSTEELLGFVASKRAALAEIDSEDL